MPASASRSVYLIDARSDGAPLDQATELACGWDRLEGLVATAAELTDTMAADPLAHVGQGYHRFRRYAPRMLRALDIQAAGVTAPLLHASTLIADDEKPETRPVGFLRRGSKWHRHLNAQEEDGHRLWEVAVLFHLRDAFRSGDIWVPHSRRYSDLKQALVPAEAVKDILRLAVPLDPEAWLADRKTRMTDGLARLAKAARAGAIPRRLDRERHSETRPLERRGARRGGRAGTRSLRPAASHTDHRADAGSRCGYRLHGNLHQCANRRALQRPDRHADGVAG